MSVFAIWTSMRISLHFFHMLLIHSPSVQPLSKAGCFNVGPSRWARSVLMSQLLEAVWFLDIFKATSTNHERNPNNIFSLFTQKCPLFKHTHACSSCILLLFVASLWLNWHLLTCDGWMSVLLHVRKKSCKGSIQSRLNFCLLTGTEHFYIRSPPVELHRQSHT